MNSNKLGLIFSMITSDFLMIISHAWKKLILNKKNASKGILEAHFTKSQIQDFVSRDNAGFSAFTQIRGDFEVYFTKSKIMDFVNQTSGLSSSPYSRRKIFW